MKIFLLHAFLLMFFSARSAAVDPSTVQAEFDSSAELTNWIVYTSSKVIWTNDAGDGAVRIVSDDDVWRSFRREDFSIDAGAYSLTFRAKVVQYGSDTPLFLRIYDGTYAMELKLLTNGASVRSTSGWQTVPDSVVATNVYRNFELCADGAFVNLYMDDRFLMVFEMPLQTAADRLQLLAKGSAGNPSQSQISMVTFRGAPVVTGSIGGWKSEAVDTLSSVIPESPMPLVGGIWNSSVTENYTSSGSQWTITNWTEEVVYQARIKHDQYGSSSNYLPYRSWDLRLGKGGQIYSLVSAGKETIPPQYRDDYGGQWAPWMDEVWQATLVNTSTNNPDYFHHQAGVYLNKYRTDPPELDHPFYSPMLMAGIQSNTTYLTASWSQQAHVPTPYRSHCITYQKTRNAGTGILEITQVLHNFGTNSITFSDTPWGGVRRSTYEYHYIAGTNGIPVLQPYVAFGQGTPLDLNLSGGWVAFANNTNQSSASGMAVVFGKDHTPYDGFQRGSSRWYWGYAGGTNTGNETDWRNYLVGCVQRRINLYQGESFFVRYYFVFGGLPAISNLVNAYSLVNRADYGQLAFSTTNTAQLSWYVGADGLLTTVPQSGKPVWMTTWAAPVPGSKPLFYMRSVVSGRVYVSTNPYLLCEGPDPGYNQKAYDGFSEYIGLLGYSTE